MILIFLWHFPSAIIPILTIPVAVIICVHSHATMGMTLEHHVARRHRHRHRRHGGRGHRGGGADPQEAGARRAATDGTATTSASIIDAVKEVGGPSFFALLVIAVSFLPVLTLEAQEGRLFKPLAYTKNFAMIVAAVLAITLDPALRLLFTRMEQFRVRPRWLAAHRERACWSARSIRRRSTRSAAS